MPRPWTETTPSTGNEKLLFYHTVGQWADGISSLIMLTKNQMKGCEK
jgi:hypothetical protein